MTFRAVALGLFLALVFGAANAYLGMKAGQTIAATIPAAVIAIAVFRAMGGGVLEQNIARTAASVGEALVAAAIFTIPAFMMVEINGDHLWANLRATLLAIRADPAGGRPDRRLFHRHSAAAAVRREPTCRFPESVACAEVVKSGQEGGDAPKYVFGAMGFAGLLQILTSDKGLQIFRDYAEGFLAFPAFRGPPLQYRKAAHRRCGPHRRRLLVDAQFFAGADRHRLHHRAGAFGHQRLRAACWRGGFSSRCCSSSIPTWRIAWERRKGARWDVLANSVWYNIVRPIAVGTMLVGACNTLFGMRDFHRPIHQGRLRGVRQSRA